MKIWFLTNAPSPYQMEYISAVQDEQDMEIAIRLMRSGYHDSAWAPSSLPSNATIMPTMAPESWRDEFRIHGFALKEALKSDYDAYILSGLYTSPTFVLCCMILNMRKKPWAVWLERPWPQEYNPQWTNRISSRSRLAKSIRGIILGKVIRNARKVFCIGSAAMDAYSKLGATKEQNVFLPYICDISRYSKTDQKQVKELKSKLNIENETVFLYSGKLIERKGVDILISAFNRLGAENTNTALIILGDGDQQEKLEQSVNSETKDRVHFIGRVEQEKLPSYYAVADVFVFPSRYDGWGVVINEACGAGLPVIVTSCTGASQDLVQNSANGFILERDDAEGFYQKMKHLADNKTEQELFSRQSLEKSKEYTLEAGVTRFREAVLKLKQISR